MPGPETSRPAEFIYISQRKLLSLARARGMRTSWFEQTLTFEGSARLAAPLPPGSELSAGAKAKTKRVQPEQRELAIERLLTRVVRTLDREGVTDLDVGPQTLVEGGWFRFRRRLRFGVGSAEGDASISALVLVDREPVDDHGGVPALLMFGAPHHLRAPYYSEKLSQSVGARSGSATGTLFRWLQSTHRALDDDDRSDLDSLRELLTYEREDAPRIMYRLFARDDWMSNPRFPELVDHAPCEGIAQATLIAADDALTIVMASPLYVRVRSIPSPADSIEEHEKPARWLSRLIHRSASRDERATSAS